MPTLLRGAGAPALVTLLYLLGAAASPVFAQAPGAPEGPAGAAPNAPAPATGGFSPAGVTHWATSINLGGSFTSAPFQQGALSSSVPGLTGALAGLPGDQRMFQGGVSVLRSTNQQAWDFESAFTYAYVQPTGKIAESPRASVDYDFRPKSAKRYFMLARYAWYKDEVRRVLYSHQALVGVGLEAVNAKVVKLNVIPVVGIIREDKGVPNFDRRWLHGWGGLENMVLTPNPYVSIEQREGFVSAFNDTAFRALTSTVSFKGKVAKPLSLVFSFTDQFDNIAAQVLTPLPIPGVGTVLVKANEKNQVLTTAGIQLTF